MRKLLLATTALLTLSAVPASADIVLFGGSIATSIYQDSGEGFGALPRVLTLQNTPSEHGSVTPGPGGTVIVHNDAIPGSNKANTPTLLQNGWGTGADVGIGFNANEPGSDSKGGISLSQLVLSIFDANNVAVKSFTLAPVPINFTKDQLALEGGNGKGLWRFVLDGTEQTEFNQFVLANLGNGVLNFHTGLEATLGIPVESSAGAESFLFYHSDADGGVCIGCAPTPTAAVPRPATWAMMILGFFGIGGLAMAKRRREGHTFRMV